MDYHANIDGVVEFAREVWPALRERHAQLVFTIVGRDPAAEVRQLAALPGIEVTGTVPDVRPYYREAVAAIVPLRVGGGSRLKILEAMAAGCSRCIDHSRRGRPQSVAREGYSDCRHKRPIPRSSGDCGESEAVSRQLREGRAGSHFQPLRLAAGGRVAPQDLR